MNLGQFKALVSGTIKRGTSLDGLIPTWISQAARLQEQNYSFSWMRQTTTITFPASNAPLEYALSPLVKNLNWLKPILDSNEDGTEWYGDELIGVEDREVLGVTGGSPAGFWLEGDNGAYKLKLDAIPRNEYKVKLSWYKYTDWPVDDNATPILLLRGEYVLLCQTLVIYANAMKDARMVEQYRGLLGDASNMLLRSEEELKMAHQNDLKMQYNGLS